MIAYFDCFSGLSGDMILGALIDTGASAEWVSDQLKNLPLTGFKLAVSKVSRHGIGAVDLKVEVDEHVHSRNYRNIKDLLQNSRLPESVRHKSLAIFEKLARAEAGVHGCSMDEVHFHEVGGVDALVDVVGSVLAMDHLGIRQVQAAKVPLGSGFVKCQHGMLPLPAPATMAILKDIPVYGTHHQAELVTPTGAAIIATLADRFGPPPDFSVQTIGYGAGDRQLENQPNLLRVFIGTAAEKENTGEASGTESIVAIETTIDDMNPELFGYLIERLFDDGVVDLCLIPVYMKKNRPGTMVQVLCPHEKKDAVTTRILTETTSLGVRFYPVRRQVLARETITAETRFGSVAAKRIRLPAGNTRVTPEYEDCRRIASKKKLPIVSVYEALLSDIADA